MINLYATLIRNKRRTIDQIPKNLRTAVIDKLKELGYDDNGDPIAI